MRKAKIALSAIAIFAVVGGAFAFKTSRAVHPFFKLDAAGTVCTVPTTAFYTSDPNLNIGITTTLSTINTFSHTGVCTATILYPAL
ncbi:hypothetical protein SAMN05428988_3192 [Chitinophaga sp. YR573]|uniref:hypothetical protein n=1 Tax=Chitinophaga sp. YR573 TaxID=1881040 RepID=UPI0008CF17CC|nr:hypothetical protein [Chitinophaga sp. YR573]SEW21270.1 hypothetical protein SAMN05428988_3192 [Chitinophaga sp. YR573]